MKGITSTPVVLMIFNRPEQTAAVFKAIRLARPTRLFVIADGPRSDRAGESALCEATRKTTESVDWDCEIVRLYRKENLGCRACVMGGLDWVFQQVEEAIILEDDCVPDPSFFHFCGELLGRYREDSRVGLIGGVNFQFGRNSVPESYYFSRHCHIWGWATWRRAWRHFDGEMTGWPKLREADWLRRKVGSGRATCYWRAVFDDCHGSQPGSLNSWAVPWTFSCWKEGLLAILPSRNLVSNIGFGEGSTHTLRPNRFANMPVRPMPFPLEHPTSIRPFVEADRYTERIHYYGQDFIQWIVWSSRLPISLRRMRAIQQRIRQILSLPVHPLRRQSGAG